MVDLTPLTEAAAKPYESYKRRRAANAEDGEFSDYVLPRPELHPVALHGILGEMVDAACANSEAVPSTVAVHILARFAVTMGRSAYINIGDERRHLRMNALIVGPTSKGRKGTSAAMPRRLFEMVEQKARVAPVRVEQHVLPDIEAGKLDAADMVEVVAALRNWENDGTWDRAYAG